MLKIWKKKTQLQKKKKIIIIFCFCVFLAILGVISWRLCFPSYFGAVTAKIYQEGTLLYTIPLNKVEEDYKLIVKSSNGGENIIFVSKGKISVLEADCPDQVCVKRGMVSYSNLPIVCMPNQLVIKFEKNGEITEVDTAIP